jgi:hypothetical protein
MDAEFEDWYRAVHLRESVELLPGVTRGRFFTRVQLDEVPDGPYKYMALYEVADDLGDETVVQFLDNRRERAAAAAEGRPSTRAISPAMDPFAMVGFFRQFGEEVRKEV